MKTPDAAFGHNLVPLDGSQGPYDAPSDPPVSAPSGHRLTFPEVVESLRTQLAAFAHAPHEEHAGPLCPICGLVGNLRRALEDYSDA